MGGNNSTTVQLARQPGEPTAAESTDPDAKELDERIAPEDADHGPAGSDGEALAKTTTRSRPGQRRLSLSISARGLIHALVVVALVAGLATFAWLYFAADDRLTADALRADNRAHAEKAALDYAVNAATMNYHDLGGWKTKLVAGTSDELNGKLTKAADDMQQILVPLQWTSSAQPLVAKVRSDTGGIYVVDCFVGVQTKTVQAPDALQSTATYSLTLDANNNWQITDVGGIGAVVGEN